MENRIIKFRAWDGDQMYESPYFFEINFQSDSKMPYRFYEDWRDLEDGRSKPCYIMQFTGLKDKNGKEIYEGDRLNDGITIIWRDDLASFALRKDDWMYDHYFGEAVDPGKCEVIGNIYETV